MGRDMIEFTLTMFQNARAPDHNSGTVNRTCKLTLSSLPAIFPQVSGPKTAPERRSHLFSGYGQVESREAMPLACDFTKPQAAAPLNHPERSSAHVPSSAACPS